MSYRILTRRLIRSHFHRDMCAISSPFSTDDDFQQAVRRLKRNGPVRNKKTNLKLVPESIESGESRYQESNVQQLRRSKQVHEILSEELCKSRQGSKIEITEVSPSRDLRRIVVWWQLFSATDGPGQTTVGMRSSWLRPAELQKEEIQVSRWLEANAPKFRFMVQLQLNSKYACELVFKYDRSRENAAALEKVFARISNMNRE